MSEIIKQINVDGVDYDIVSESAEKKIAELESNAALTNITFGTRDFESNLLKVGFGEVPDSFDDEDDIYIGKGVYIDGQSYLGYGVYIDRQSYLGQGVKIGANHPVLIDWANDGTLRISGNGGNITIGSNVNITESNSGGSGSNSLPVRSYDGTILKLGTNNKPIVAEDSNGEVISVIGPRVEIGTSNIGANISIGTNLAGKRLQLIGPLSLAIQSGERSLSIGGTSNNGSISIDWTEEDKIIFTNNSSGKKATLTLS